MQVPSSDLLRAARVLLDIAARDLAEKAGVSKRSLVRIEAGEQVSLETALRVQQALERAGIEFLPETNGQGPGIRVQKQIVRKLASSPPAQPVVPDLRPQPPRSINAKLNR